MDKDNKLFDLPLNPKGGTLDECTGVNHHDICEKVATFTNEQISNDDFGDWNIAEIMEYVNTHFTPAEVVFMATHFLIDKAEQASKDLVRALMNQSGEIN